MVQQPLEATPPDPVQAPPEQPVLSGEPVSITLQPETANEGTLPPPVHKARGKRVKHYLFEFFMLFLAVFCGFIAENWREKMVEHQREKEYIRSIVEDLKSDTTQSNKVLARLKSLQAGIDSVLVALASPGISDNSNKAYELWTQNLGLEVFVSNDRTIQQLKNSGALRLIRNKAVSDSIMNYDQVLKKYYVQSDLMYSGLRDVTNYSELFDFISLEKSRNVPVPLPPGSNRLLNKSYADLQLWSRGLTGLISWLKEVNGEGKRLVVFISKEYGLE
jgi:hypothetical protein